MAMPGRRSRRSFSFDGKLPVLIGDWTEEQEKKILLSLDPVAAMAEADKAALERLMAEVETTDAALQSMLDDLAAQHGIGAAETSVTAEPQTDRAAELQKEWKTALGQIWEIPGRGGVHRMMCGDSTKQDQVEALLAGVKPFLMVTDPPYGVEYDPNWRNMRGKHISTMGKRHLAQERLERSLTIPAPAGLPPTRSAGQALPTFGTRACSGLL